MVCLRLISILVTLLAFTAGTTLPAQQAPTTPSLINQLLDVSLADGFDFPVGNLEGAGSYSSKVTGKKYHGWRATIVHSETVGPLVPTREAWKGNGGSSTDRGQPVFAIAAGTIIDLHSTPRGQGLVIEHRFLENGQPMCVWSVCGGLANIKLKLGDTLKRRQQVGEIAAGAEGATQLSLEIHRSHNNAVSTSTSFPSIEEVTETPSSFIRAHRRLAVPSHDPAIIIAIKHDYQIHLCSNGKIVKTLPIALGQVPLGKKTTNGDNCTPEGEYRVIQKAEGPFDGEYGQYLGSAWIRLNYPNTADARSALMEKRITQQECDAIVMANAKNQMPSDKTSLGGGIGIHGWASNWGDGPQNLTWGCISLRSADLTTLFSFANKGTKVIIHP